MYDIRQVSKLELNRVCREISKSIYTFKIEEYAKEHLAQVLKKNGIWDDDYAWVKDVSSIMYGGYVIKGLAFKVETTKPTFNDLFKLVSKSAAETFIWAQITKELSMLSELEVKYTSLINTYLQTSISSKNIYNCTLFWFDYIRREFEKEYVVPVPTLTHEELLATNQYYRENQHVKDEIRLLLMEKELLQ